MPKIEITGAKGLVQSTGTTMSLTLDDQETVEKIVMVSNSTGFVQNSRSNATWTQPANTYISEILLLVTGAPTVTNSSQNLGYAVGVGASDASIVTAVADEVIDAAGSTTPLAVGALLEMSLNRKTTDATTLAADASYASASRTVHLGTTASDHAIAAAGAVKWIIKYYKVS